MNVRRIAAHVAAGLFAAMAAGCAVRPAAVPPPPHTVPAPAGDEIPSLPLRRPDAPVALCDIAAFDMEKGSGGDVGGIVQRCIQRAVPGGVIVFPPGRYRIERQVVVDRPLWLTSGELEPFDPQCESQDARCAEFVVGEDFYQAYGFFTAARGAERVVVDHLIFNGNKDARLKSRAADVCRASAENNRYGYNVGFRFCVDCWFLNSVSKNALCGTALEVLSANVAFSRFENNGLHRKYLWADGLTAKECPGKFVYANYFEGNTDVDCVVGTGPCDVIGNRIVHQPDSPSSTFSAINIFTFKKHTAPHAGTRVGKNTIFCGNRVGCGAGIYMGSDAWAPGGSNRPVAGPVYVYDNYILAAQGGILIDAASDVRLSRNVIHSTGGRYHAGCGDRDFPLASRSEASTITSNGEDFPYAVLEWNFCVPNHQF